MAATPAGVAVQADWDRFRAEPRRYRLPALDRWFDTAEPTVRSQFAARDADRPRSRAAVRAALDGLDHRIGSRRATFGNQARTDRLLRLMPLTCPGWRGCTARPG